MPATCRQAAAGLVMLVTHTLSVCLSLGARTRARTHLSTPILSAPVCAGGILSIPSHTLALCPPRPLQNDPAAYSLAIFHTTNYKENCESLMSARWLMERGMLKKEYAGKWAKFFEKHKGK
eukprot:SAG22_NODE_1207_length_5166_cov_4.472272_3_plen_121_part_00